MIPRIVTALLLSLLLFAAPAAACFGPKLYLGTEASPRHDVLFELISLYVKEKTGTETVRVDLKGADPAEAIRGEKVDLALLEGGDFAVILLEKAGWPSVASGERPLKDLQFTTVGPALKKLNAQLTQEHLESLAERVRKGEPPAAAARRFLMERGWI